MKKSFNIIVITPEKYLKNEISSLIALFEAGLALLHIRKPDFSKEELADYLKQIPKQYYKKIVLHSHFELLKTHKLKGAHLNEKSRKSIRLINFLLRNKIRIISTSFHSIDEIKHNRRKYEYFFLSPVFDSISKDNYKSNFDLEEVLPFLKANKKNIIALGGINNLNINLIKQAGFSGAATIGYIWESKNPTRNYKNLLSKIK